jgi:hypothetical protein
VLLDHLGALLGAQPGRVNLKVIDAMRVNRLKLRFGQARLPITTLALPALKFLKVTDDPYEQDLVVGEKKDTLGKVVSLEAPKNNVIDDDIVAH